MYMIQYLIFLDYESSCFETQSGHDSYPGLIQGPLGYNLCAQAPWC